MVLSGGLLQAGAGLQGAVIDFREMSRLQVLDGRRLWGGLAIERSWCRLCELIRKRHAAVASLVTEL
jgi:hypothetical protein